VVRLAIMVLALATAMLVIQASGARAQDGGGDGQGRPVATHDEPQGALWLRGTGTITDHPDVVSTRSGEGEGFDCFDGPALWYRLWAPTPIAVGGQGQDVAIFDVREGVDTVSGIEDLVGVACLTSVSGDLTEAPLVDGAAGGYRYLAVSTAAGVAAFTVVQELDVIVDTDCLDDGSADVRIDVVNLTEQPLPITLNAHGVPDVSGEYVVASRDRIVVNGSVLVDGFLHASVFSEGLAGGFGGGAVDCRPNSASNDLLTDAIAVERTPLRTLLNERWPALDTINGTAGTELGALGSRCHGSGDIWYSFVATAETTGFTGGDDQHIAIFRSPTTAPQSIADLQLVDCAQPEWEPTFAAIPGEVIYVAVSRDLTQRIYVTDPHWTIPGLFCDDDGARLSIDAGSHDGPDPRFIAELRSGEGSYSDTSDFSRVHFANLPDGTYELQISDPDSGEYFVPPEEIVIECRKRVPNDRVDGAVTIGDDAVALHPDQVVTRGGEDGLGCFDGPASWYRAAPGTTSVLLGAGQDFAVFAGGVAPSSLADLDEVACFELHRGLRRWRESAVAPGR